MYMAAGPSSLVETPEALLISLRSGGVGGPVPAEPERSGGLRAAGDREVGESGYWQATARGDVRSERRELDRWHNIAKGSPRRRGEWRRHQSGPPG